MRLLHPPFLWTTHRGAVMDRDSRSFSAFLLVPVGRS
jgi:hypothetical protein